MPAEHRRLQRAYTEGVNAGLAALDRPRSSTSCSASSPNPGATRTPPSSSTPCTSNSTTRPAAASPPGVCSSISRSRTRGVPGSGRDLLGRRPRRRRDAGAPDTGRARHRLRDAGGRGRRIPHRRRFHGVRHRQQQLGGGRIADRGRRGHPRRRHAPGSEPAQHLVPGVLGMAR